MAVPISNRRMNIVLRQASQIKLILRIGIDLQYEE